jgi:hypothetical protein
MQDAALGPVPAGDSGSNHGESGRSMWIRERCERIRVGPTDRGGVEVPSIEGMVRGFLSMEKKREGYRESAGDGFIPYMTIFCYWG